jgi:hypothetical protein
MTVGWRTLWRAVGGVGLPGAGSLYGYGIVAREVVPLRGLGLKTRSVMTGQRPARGLHLLVLLPWLMSRINLHTPDMRGSTV